MLMRRLGRTGLKVAPLCFGGNVFGWTIDEARSYGVLDAYVDGGGNFIDTADVYSTWVPGNVGGESESILGRWMRERGNRDAMVIATKLGSSMGSGPLQSGLSRRYIMAAVEASLTRLRTDYIDLYQAHRDDADTPVDETLRAFDDLVHQGKVRYIGASNFSAWRLTRSLWESDRLNLARYDSVQPFYNLIAREAYERELEPLCLDQQIAVIPYSSLANGFLSGKYRSGKELPASARASGVRKQYMNQRGFAVLEQVDGVARARGATPAQVALAWLIGRPGITAPIVSATSVEQMRELFGAVELGLSDEERTALDIASSWHDESR